MTHVIGFTGYTGLDLILSILFILSEISINLTGFESELQWLFLALVISEEVSYNQCSDGGLE